MAERTGLNLTTGDLDVLRRLEDARRDVGAIADELLNRKTSKREQRHDMGRRLNAVKASLHTVILRLDDDA